ncbi:MAG: DsrE family protein [Pseudomonadota bacterium]
MRNLFIINDAPYGNERPYNALRLANALAHEPEQEIRVFLLGDAVFIAKQGQKPPSGFYNLQVMLGKIARLAPERVDVCGVCMDARGMADGELMPGTERSTLEKLAYWTLWADKVLVF